MRTPSLVILGIHASIGLAVDGVTNANHIFNAIHDSMRQFGNALNHNGMSFFIANVPEDVEFYHGTATPEPVRGLQWLAFEPEHALAFARPAKMRERAMRSKHHGSDRSTPNHTEGERRPTQNPYEKHHERNGVRASQAPMFDDALTSDPQPDLSESGYLQTYRTKRKLRLLYLDGQSAAKSTLGTLDTQDVVLRDKDDTHAPSPIEGDRERAKNLCKMASTVWENQIDGILRMVGGFEIILCSFERNLDVVHIKAVAQTGEKRSGNNLDYQRAISARNNGIGGGRVSVEYNSFLTMFAFPGAFYYDRQGRPRVDNSSSELFKIRSMVSAMIIHDRTDTATTSWQAVTDMIVSRYAGRLELWTSEKNISFQALRSGLESTLRPFIDDQDRDRDIEWQRCATQFLPRSIDNTSVAAQAITVVAGNICSSIMLALTSSGHLEALAVLQELKDYLQWTTWKECRGCDIDEVCKLPIWPVGDAEDFLQPRCTRNISRVDRGDYWDFSGSPRE